MLCSFFKPSIKINHFLDSLQIFNDQKNYYINCKVVNNFLVKNVLQ